MKKSYLSILGILLIGSAIAIIIIKTAPQPQKKQATQVAPLVETTKFTPAMLPPYWKGGATVNANDSVQLIAQVGGQLEWFNPDIKPGDYAKKGTVLARVEQADYELQVQQKQAALVQAQANLDIELGQVENARSDYRLSGVELKPAAKALALRQPQLASAKAALKMAQAELQKAKLNLQRTEITMPFDGHVLDQLAFKGAYVTSASPVVNVIDSRLFWAQVSVPNDFLNILDRTRAATIRLLKDNRTRSADIFNVSPAVNANDRQARVLIGIKQPLKENSDQPIIRYNDYIEVTLYAEQPENLYRIASDKVDAGKVWAVDKNKQLTSIDFTLVFKGRQYSWVQFNPSDIKDQQLLLSDINGKQIGLPVRVKSEGGAL